MENPYENETETEIIPDEDDPRTLVGRCRICGDVHLTEGSGCDETPEAEDGTD